MLNIVIHIVYVIYIYLLPLKLIYSRLDVEFELVYLDLLFFVLIALYFYY